MSSSRENPTVLPAWATCAVNDIPSLPLSGDELVQAWDALTTRSGSAGPHRTNGALAARLWALSCHPNAPTMLMIRAMARWPFSITYNPNWPLLAVAYPALIEQVRGIWQSMIQNGVVTEVQMEEAMRGQTELSEPAPMECTAYRRPPQVDALLNDPSRPASPQRGPTST